MSNTTKTSEYLDQFLLGFIGIDLKILKESIYIPNTPDIQPEVLRFNLEYGKDYGRVLNKVDSLRKKLKLDYSDLQVLLQRRLPQ
ncbi:MAG: hypothetical protein PHD81_00405 [Candidatus Nanoarchaeia archaeon]|nr:hypothetical protein [Candidatus Nanoarchaeia archaeon]MDD5587551.1 hypothetical protein [Candidatus Nanoarchaeia archaeon]